MLAKHALSQLSYGPVTRRRMLASSRSLRRKFCHARLRPTGLRRARFALLYERGCATRSRRRSVVGLGRLELPTSRLSSARSNQLSYKPLTRGASICAPPVNAGCIAQALSPWRVFVREERETKTAKSRQWSSTIPRLLAPDVSKTIR